MLITSVIKYEGDNDTFVWKHPCEDFNTRSQLIVHQSQEAILFKNGMALDLFGPGRYVLNTENIPILRRFINIPSGGITPYHCEIYFINKIDIMDMKWGTSTPLQINDPKYNVILPVGANGQFGLRVADSRKFLAKIVGTVSSMNKITLINKFRGILMKNIKEYISKEFILKKRSFLEISSYLTEISESLKQQLSRDFFEYGLQLANFNVTTMFVPESDSSYQKIKDALAKKAEMNIVGFSYAEGRTFDIYEKAAENEGGLAAPLINAGVGLAVAAKTGGVLNRQNQGDLFEEIDTRCPNCRSLVPVGSAFCPKCGFKLGLTRETDMITCPKCGQLTPNGAFCSRCGTKLAKISPEYGGKIDE